MHRKRQELESGATSARLPKQGKWNNTSTSQQQLVEEMQEDLPEDSAYEEFGLMTSRTERVPGRNAKQPTPQFAATYNEATPDQKRISYRDALISANIELATTDKKNVS